MKQSNTPKRHARLSYFYLFATAFIWGTAFVAQGKVVGIIGTFYFNGIRFIIGTFSLIPVFLILEKSKTSFKSMLLPSLLCGCVLFIACALQQLGIEIGGSVSKAAFITGMYLVLTPVFGFFIFKKRTTKIILLSCIISLTGLYLLTVPEGEIFKISAGDFVLFIGAIFWAFHILLLERYAPKLPPIRFSAMQFFVCSVLSIIVGAFREELSVNMILDAKWPILYTGILSVGIAYTFQVLGQRDVPAPKAALIFSMESLFASAGAAIILRETLSQRAYWGCGFMFCGILLSNLKLKIRKK